jgi:hypothetical protein
MNYLGRPIFPFFIDWSRTAPARDITYDLRETLIGFGAEYYTPTNTYTTNAWDFQVYLECGSDFLSYESFCDSLVGRCTGFWLPCPLQAAQFSAGISTTQFKIVAEGLADTWQNRPDQFLLFTFLDGTQAAGQIQAVVANGDGTETVTMTAPLAEAPAAGTTITRLHYVRFAQDTEQYSMDGESAGSLKVSVLELPMEYTNAETGLQPIWLYDFRMAAPVLMHWRYTSFAAPVVSGNNLFAAFPMTHKQQKDTIDGQSNPLTVEAKVDSTHPLSMLAGVPPAKPLWLTIYLCYYGTPNNATQIWNGFVSNVQDDGIKYTAKCETRLKWLKSKAPKFILGSTCNWNLYDPKTCKVPRALNSTTVKILAFSETYLPTISCSFVFNFATLMADWQKQDWFTGGTLEVGMGTQYELRSIIASSYGGGLLLLTLNQPLRFAAVNAQCEITAGCDHTFNGPNGCTLKFNNFKNFGGFVAIPQRNLSLQAIQSSVSQGNKKI